MGLGAKSDARVTTLSGGQQRRLDVGVALVGDPELLFLDEPTTGFDPSARREAWQVVKSLAELGKTVLLTTHYMDEAQFLADRVAVIAAGRIVAKGPPSSLGGRDQARPRVSFRLPPGAALPRGPRPQGLSRPTGGVELVAENLTATLYRLTSWAVEHGIELDDLSVVRPTLEDVYLELTGGLRPGPRTGPRPRPRRAPRRRGRAGRGRAAGRPVNTVVAHGPPGPLHQQGVLAEPRVRFLHLRLPAHVPGDLHRLARLGQGAPRRAHGQGVDVLRRRHGGLRRDKRLLHERRHDRDLPARPGDPEAHQRYAAAGGRLLRRPGAARALRRHPAGRHHGRVRQARLPGLGPGRASRSSTSSSCSSSAPAASARSGSPSPR